MHEEELLNEFFFNKSQIKSYSACPYMNSAIRCENILQLDKQFNWNFASKLMNFAFMDNIETAKNSLPAMNLALKNLANSYRICLLIIKLFNQPLYPAKNAQ